MLCAFRREMEICDSGPCCCFWIVRPQPLFILSYLTPSSRSATLAVALAVIAHPSIVTRIIIVAIFTVLGIVACLLPFPRIGEVALRFADASTGSFGLVLSIAILVRNTAWGNVWERLWVDDGDGWGTSKEKGLSAAYCLLFCVGVACDWLLHAKLGENPDEVRSLYDDVASLTKGSYRSGIVTSPSTQTTCQTTARARAHLLLSSRCTIASWVVTVTSRPLCRTRRCPSPFSRALFLRSSEARKYRSRL